MSTTSRRAARPATPAASPLAAPTAPVFVYPTLPDHAFGWGEIAAALTASKGITTGWWRVGAKLSFAAITARMGPPGHEHEAPASPTALVGFEGLALFASPIGGDLVFDAGNGCAPVPAGAVAPEPVKAAAKRVPAKKGRLIK